VANNGHRNLFTVHCGNPFRDGSTECSGRNIRITETLKDKAERVAKEREITVSEFITDYLKRLPTPKD
jgi:hypothetical protein